MNLNIPNLLILAALLVTPKVSAQSYAIDWSTIDGGLTKEKFTYQLSDHLPLWIQVNTATEGFKLEQIIRG